MTAFIDGRRDAYEVEQIFSVLPIAPSTYDAHKGRQADPSRISSGSSIFFGSHILTKTERGVKKSTSEKELTQNSIPSKNRKTPVSIGFLVSLYGPVLTTFSGRLKGTGIPCALRK